MKKGASGKSARQPDMEETKAHVLAAGRELLLAAQGALSFCRDYAKASSPAASKSQLMDFFSRAIDVADELSKGLVTATHVPAAARDVAGRFFDAVGREMEEQEKERKREEMAAKRRRPCRPDTRRSSSATRTASSTTRRTPATSRSRTSAR